MGLVRPFVRQGLPEKGLSPPESSLAILPAFVYHSVFIDEACVLT
jgi:hypothetical protein